MSFNLYVEVLILFILQKVTVSVLAPNHQNKCSTDRMSSAPHH